MNWEAIGAIGEIVSGIVVVASLIYLAIQIRQNTTQSEASSIHAYMQMYSSVFRSISDNKEKARVFRIGLDDINALDEDEKTQFLFLLTQFLTTWEGMFTLWEKKLVDEYRWAGMRYDIAMLLNTSGGRWVWQDARAAWEGFPTFVSMIEDVLENPPTKHRLRFMNSGSTEV